MISAISAVPNSPFAAPNSLDSPHSCQDGHCNFGMEGPPCYVATSLDYVSECPFDTRTLLDVSAWHYTSIGRSMLPSVEASFLNTVFHVNYC